MCGWRPSLCALSTLIAFVAIHGPAQSAPPAPSAQSERPGSGVEEDAAVASLELAWDAPTPCPSRESLRKRLSIALGDSRPSEKVHARGRIRRDPSGTFVLSLGIRSGTLDDTRTVSDASCDVIADAAVVMLVLAIDPSRALQSEPVSPGEENAAHEARDVTPSASVPEEPAPPQKRATRPKRPGKERASTLKTDHVRRVTVGLGLGPSAEFGTFGRPAMGASASVYASFDQKFRAEIALGAWMPVQLPLENAPNFGIRISAAVAGARGCFLPLMRGATQLGACAGLDVMTAHASGFGTRQLYSDDATWVAAGAGLMGRERLTRAIHLVGNVQGVYALDGPHYGLQIGNEARPIHRVSFGGRVTLSVELALF